mgnify:CR=1 FL=1
MNNDSPIKALIVVTATALLCSILVTVAAVTLHPIQRAYQDLERNRFLVGISGLTDAVAELPDRDVISLYQKLEARIVNLDTGSFDDTYNPDTFDTWKTAADPVLSIAIPAELDGAKLSRRSRLVTVFLVRDGDKLQRMMLPIYGQGMWSTIYGYIALEADLNTIADITFFEQAETAGIGDKFLRPAWLASWRGRKLYDETGTLRFQIGGRAVDPASSAARYQVDGISGATVTIDALMRMVTYWFGTHGFAPFLDSYRSEVDR